MIKIDLKGKKILTELDFDATISNTELAKKVGLNKKSVEYRIKKMENQGLIQGYYPIIDFIKLGYYYCRSFIKLQYVNKKIKEKMEDYIKKNTNFTWSLWLQGPYELAIATWTKSLKDYKLLIHEFNTKFNKYIKSIVLSLAIELNQYPYDFLLGKRTEKEITIMEQRDFLQIDLLDKKILKELSKNSRQSHSEIARKLKTNYKNISYRIKRLKENKILLGTRAIINHKLLGYEYYKIIFHLTHNIESSFFQLKNYFKNRIETSYIVNDIGMADFDTEVVVRSNEHLMDIIEDIQTRFPDLIKDYFYLTVIKTIKMTYLPADLFNEK